MDNDTTTLRSNRSSSSSTKVAFIVVAFNQKQFIRQSVLAAFAQDYVPLDIVLSDDCSNDGTYEIMLDLSRNYAGPHSVRVLRTPMNVGLIKHIEFACSHIQSEFIVLSAGDDVSSQQRTSALVRRWEETGRKRACVYSDFNIIDLNGDLVRRAPCHRDLSKLTVKDYLVQPFALMATYGFAKGIVSDFGLLDANVVNEDFVFTFRSLLSCGNVEYLDEALVQYRVGVGISSKPVGPNRRREYFLLQNLADARTVGSDSEILDCLERKIATARKAFSFDSSPTVRNAVSLLLAAVRSGELVEFFSLVLKRRLATLHYILRYARMHLRIGGKRFKL